MATTLYTGSCPYGDCTKPIKIKAVLAHAHNVIGCANCKRLGILIRVDDRLQTIELSAMG
jgi:hypothetical protein